MALVEAGRATFWHPGWATGQTGRTPTPPPFLLLNYLKNIFVVADLAHSRWADLTSSLPGLGAEEEGRRGGAAVAGLVADVGAGGGRLHLSMLLCLLAVGHLFCVLLRRPFGRDGVGSLLFLSLSRGVFGLCRRQSGNNDGSGRRSGPRQVQEQGLWLLLQNRLLLHACSGIDDDDRLLLRRQLLLLGGDWPSFSSAGQRREEWQPPGTAAEFFPWSADQPA